MERENIENGICIEKVGDGDQKNFDFDDVFLDFDDEIIFD